MWEMNNVLVPMDFSDQSEQSLKCSFSLAKQFGASIDILNITDFEKISEDYAGHRGTKESLIKVIENEAQLKVNKIVKERDWQGLKVYGINISGTAADKIIQVARQRKTHVITMSTRGKGNTTDFIIGSTTYKIIRTAPCPVLSISNPKMGLNATKVLFTTDFSENSYFAYEYAVSIAKKFNSELHLLNVFDPTIPDIAKSEEKFSALKGAAFQEGVLNIKASQVKEKDAADGIIKYIEANGIDMVVIATHGHSGVRQYFLGSKTVDVISRSTVPVLLVRRLEY